MIMNHDRSHIVVLLVSVACSKLMDIIRAQEQSRNLHEQFHHQLERAQDGFSVIADYYGRGVFNKVFTYSASSRHVDEMLHSICQLSSVCLGFFAIFNHLNHSAVAYCVCTVVSC